MSYGIGWNTANITQGRNLVVSNKYIRGEEQRLLGVFWANKVYGITVGRG
jgi:hypothetical protein